MMWEFVAGFIAGEVAGLALFALWRRRPLHTRPDPRVAELSELAGGLAHELRNPLSTLMVNLQLLAEDLSKDDAGAEQVRRRSLNKLETIRCEAERLQHLLDDFLKLAGPCRPQRQRVDLNRTIADLAEFYGPQAESAGIVLRLKPHDQPLICDVDPDMIKQAILNILINGQQAMSAGGELILRTRPGPESTAVVDISDTGHGIAPENVAKVFQPFFSTKPHGTGLGLATTDRLIAEHRGKISVHSELGKGTQFSVLLPAIPAGRA